LVQISNWKIIDADELARNLFVSPEDGFHVRIGGTEYQILFDNNEFVELDKNMTSKDPLHLWTQKICRSIERCDGKTKLKDAPTGVGKSKGKELVICCMDFAFIGGSMGAVVGEKIARGMITQLKQHLPL
jgi:acetyl-CoA carboxylase carboxyl transferase subunit beta